MKPHNTILEKKKFTSIKKDSSISIPETIITKNFKETINFGIGFSKLLKSGDVVCLTGQLGCGKTTLIKGIAKGLGIKKDIISPTFILAREFPEKKFVHIDMYRTKNIEEFFQSGLDEYINKENICVIEWAEKIEKIFNQNHYKINITILSKTKRKIEICF